MTRLQNDVHIDDLKQAWRAVYSVLLDHRDRGGFWRGKLCSSPLATATAVCALSVYRAKHAERAGQNGDGLSHHHQILRGIDYLLKTQNTDGGWGDTDKSASNIATSYLVYAALSWAGQVQGVDSALAGAVKFIERKGEVIGLRQRYGRDQTFVAPILMTCAIAQVAGWDDVPQLPFELAACPQSVYRFLRMPVVSYAIPALVAVGLARHRTAPRPPLPLRWLRDLVTERCLKIVRRMQPPSGGFLEAIPLTSFVVMGLCQAGRAGDPVVQAGMRFLSATQREDGSWPVDVDLSTWLTTLTINALSCVPDVQPESLVSIEWLLGCQHRERHPFTGASPGGWGWTDQSGAVPDVDDTAGALLALVNLWPRLDGRDQLRVLPHVVLGISWLLDLQNADGGWPTFCRGWGRLPFDRSAVDLTAHALRALSKWQTVCAESNESSWVKLDLSSFSGEARTTVLRILRSPGVWRRRIERALAAGIAFLKRLQRDDGSFVPLWFGNELLPNEENPFYGTARCLLALSEIGEKTSTHADRAVKWLVAHQNADGSWGLGVGPDSLRHSADYHVGHRRGSIEETSVVLSALTGFDERPDVQVAIQQGLRWLIDQINNGGLVQATPIGLYFARLWYYEELYPVIFSLEALSRCLMARSRNHEVKATSYGVEGP